jgi:hypothetical protein
MTTRPAGNLDDLRVLARDDHGERGTMVRMERFVVQPVGTDGITGEDNARANGGLKFTEGRGAH